MVKAKSLDDAGLLVEVGQAIVTLAAIDTYLYQNLATPSSDSHKYTRTAAVNIFPVQRVKKYYRTLMDYGLYAKAGELRKGYKSLREKAGLKPVKLKA